MMFMPQPRRPLRLTALMCLGLAVAGAVRAETIETCPSMQELLVQIDTALTKSEAGTPIAQIDMMRMKLASSKALLGLSVAEAQGTWPDPLSDASVRRVSAAAKGRDGGPFDPAFAVETLQNEGPVLAEGFAGGCPGVALPERYEAHQ